MKTTLLLVALACLAAAKSAQAEYTLSNNPHDFSAPIVYSRTNLSEAPAGTIIYDSASATFFGLAPSGNPSSTSSWIQLGGTAGTNSVSTSGSSLRIESVLVATICSSNPCTMTNNTPGITSVSWNATGGYAINFSAGTFSSVPTCIFTPGSSAAGGIQVAFGSTTATSYPFVTFNSSFSAANNSFSAICMGPR